MHRLYERSATGTFIHDTVSWMHLVHRVLATWDIRSQKSRFHSYEFPVLPWDMVENSSNLCKSSLGRFFRQWVVRTGHLTLE